MVEGLLRVEDPLLLGEEFTKLFQSAKELDQKKALANEMLAKLTEITQKSQSAHDLYDVAEIFYSTGNLVEKYDESLAKSFFKGGINTASIIINSPQSLGKFSEIAQIHLNIARILKEKFRDSTGENQHLHNAIQLLSQEIGLMESLGNLPKVAQLYYAIGELYLKTDEIQKALDCYSTVETIAKEIQYSRLLFNSVEMQAQIYKKSGHKDTRTNLVNEAIEYLLSETIQTMEPPSNELHIAEIYQFVKKLYLLIDNIRDFEQYAKKEANEYIKIAKKKIKESNISEGASLYRGAALCFREIGLHIDAGSCFHLAANLFRVVKNNESFEENCLDAAREFENAKNLEKAADLYNIAASAFLERKQYDSAIECLSNAFDLIDETPGTENSKNKEQLGHKVAILLSEVAQMRAEHKNYSLAGILFLEAAVFLRRVNADWGTFLLPQIRQAVQNFYNAFLNGLKTPTIGDSVAIWGVQAAVGSWSIGNAETPRKIHLKLTMNAKIPHRDEALELFQTIATLIEERNHDLVSNLSNGMKQFFNNSPELQKLCLFLEERIPELD
ncbi:MAG: hypothetical protein RBG13Loki_3145 [Promethearchaeota archaeon CR_4]|nr:MAG: hypothetical protein RBG13Loki_3145 [Candidatus Lokiarchaeota archaeon CR_4]